MPVTVRCALLVSAIVSVAMHERARAQVKPAVSALPSWAIDSVGRLPLEQAAVRGVALNMTEQQVRQRLGMPDSVAKGYEEVIDSTTTLFYPGLTILLSRHGVEEITCPATTCRLPNGIGVGSTLAQVVRALGRGHPGYRSGLSYSLFYRPGQCDCWLEIPFDEHLHVLTLKLQNDNS